MTGLAAGGGRGGEAGPFGGGLEHGGPNITYSIEPEQGNDASRHEPFSQNSVVTAKGLKYVSRPGLSAEQPPSCHASVALDASSTVVFTFCVNA
jgi:hypothetical protein